MHIFFIITSILFSNTFPDPWNGYSVSNSENLDAFTHNPAGVSINHGIESGYFLLLIAVDIFQIILLFIMLRNLMALAIVLNIIKAINFLMQLMLTYLLQVK